ncbi:MAG TPA: DNA polymerase IV [Roseiarcus sp.]|nr:DNA polymerase IV [Roseiarcus sp.]
MNAGPWICRDCVSSFSSAAAAGLRCSQCGSPRIVADPVHNELTIAHIDCDAFYAAIEKRDNPALRDRPVIVGGGGRRGVVSTCCYIARISGVRSAMPMYQARRLCPEATVIPPDMRKYAEVGRQIRAMMQRLTPLVEPLSVDEAFLDLSGCQRLHGASAAATLARFAKDVESKVGVTVSIGLSYCKFLAKFASDLDKPRGFSIVARDQALALLAPQPIGRIWGVGRVAEARLVKAGLRTIGDVQRRGETEMIRECGPDGARLWRLANGIDERRVSPERETKSISAETTFDVDISDKAELERVLLGLCERVALRLKREGLGARSVTLKLRLPNFKLRTRARSGARPTQLASRLFAAARDLLAREADGAAFRLIGVAAADFAPAEEADRGDLIDKDVGKEKAREQAIDALREKFGAAAVVRAPLLPAKRGEGVERSETDEHL